VTERRSVAALALALAIVLWPARPAAHDIPQDVLVQMFVKPEGSRLRLLLRVPLGAMRDINFPIVGQGFLDLPRTGIALRTSADTWLVNDIALYEQQRRLGAPRLLATQVSLPSDRSFGTYDDALAHVTGPPLAADTQIIWNQALFDVLYEYDIRSDRSDFTIDTDLVRLGIRVVTVMRFLPPAGSVRAFEYLGDPGPVRLDPRWYQSALQFVRLGFHHILDGIDHLLFVFCLVIPFRRFRQLVVVVTAFTIAHSITLIISAVGLGPGALWFPPFIELLIAMSILFMALENIVLAAPSSVPGAAGTRPVNLQRRWMIAFAFGLVHGFGFSFALRDTLQFAGSHLMASLVSFNVGVELGQVLVLAILVPLLQVLFRFVISERLGTILLSAVVAHTAWHWTIERGQRLREFSLPAVDPATIAVAMRWAMGLVVVGAIWWWFSRTRVRQPQRQDH
jgi:HupE/UreJ protein